MRWRRLARAHRFGVVVSTEGPPATATPTVPDCWLSTDGRRELCCVGRVDADLDDVVEVWLWFTGTESAVELTPEEVEALAAASAVRPLGPGEQDRLLHRLGRRRAWAEHGRWGVWTVPVDEIEDVLAVALTRRARSGHRHPAVA